MDHIRDVAHQSKEKSLASQRNTIQVSAVDQWNKRLAICLHSKEWASVNVEVEVFTGPSNCETFLLDLCVLLFRWQERARSKGYRTPSQAVGLQEHGPQSVSTGVSGDADGLCDVEES